MDMQQLLSGLKVDLAIQSGRYDDRLRNRLCEAQQALEAQGITLEDTTADRDLVIMYAGWLWRSRIDGAPMPRMLVTARNNRLFGQKARTET